MKIPNRFKLFGRTFTVEYDNQLDRLKKCVGEAIFEEHKIVLQPITDTNGRNKEGVEEVFIHELLHMCFSIMGKEDISEDEAMIITLAGLIHQAFVTSEYDDCEGDLILSKSKLTQDEIEHISQINQNIDLLVKRVEILEANE